MRLFLFFVFALLAVGRRLTVLRCFLTRLWSLVLVVRPLVPLLLLVLLPLLLLPLLLLPLLVFMLLALRRLFVFWGGVGVWAAGVGMRPRSAVEKSTRWVRVSVGTWCCAGISGCSNQPEIGTLM
jgi:hypothetical protein